ncbi:hypothetical protein DYG63_19230 [Yersinia enterocolitica]|nr:hypothetical protein [Yersinia enterocolitica]EKN5104029.1 hypothetical protein [Yersinia enterocolitica]
MYLDWDEEDIVADFALIIARSSYLRAGLARVLSDTGIGAMASLPTLLAYPRLPNAVQRRAVSTLVHCLPHLLAPLLDELLALAAFCTQRTQGGALRYTDLVVLTSMPELWIRGTLQALAPSSIPDGHLTVLPRMASPNLVVTALRGEDLLVSVLPRERTGKDDVRLSPLTAHEVRCLRQIFRDVASGRGTLNPGEGLRGYIAEMSVLQRAGVRSALRKLGGVSLKASYHRSPAVSQARDQTERSSDGAPTPVRDEELLANSRHI